MTTDSNFYPIFPFHSRFTQFPSTPPSTPLNPKKPKHIHSQRARDSAHAPAATQPHTALYLSTSLPLRAVPEKHRGTWRATLLQRRPVGRRPDSRSIPPTRQFHLPSAQLELHETRTPTRTTQHARRHNHETSPPRASAHAHMGGRPENNGESTSPEAKHVTKSETRHRKQTKFSDDVLRFNNLRLTR